MINHTFLYIVTKTVQRDKTAAIFSTNLPSGNLTIIRE
jgi:hypothetical protein